MDSARENRRYLQSISENTSGFAVIDTNTPEAAVPSILAESGSYYLLGFQSTHQQPVAHPRGGVRLWRWEVNALRSGGRATPPEHAVEQIIRRVNRDAIVTDIGPLRGRFALSVRDRTFATFVLVLFAMAGIGVCIAGLAGVVSFAVARRTREIAVRVCLGATPSAIRRIVVTEALACAIAGASLGLVASFWSSKVLDRFLFGVQPGDPATMLSGAAVMLALVALAAIIGTGRPAVSERSSTSGIGVDSQLPTPGERFGRAG